MPRTKYISTLELVTHVHHDEKNGDDISIQEVLITLQNAISDIRDSGNYKAWMEVIYTEER